MQLCSTRSNSEKVKAKVWKTLEPFARIHHAQLSPASAAVTDRPCHIQVTDLGKVLCKHGHVPGGLKRSVSVPVPGDLIHLASYLVAPHP